MSTFQENQELTLCCGIPTHLHGTCCGWRNAKMIIYPSNKQEVEWQKEYLKETNSEIIINKQGTFLSYGGFVSNVDDIPS